MVVVIEEDIVHFMVVWSDLQEYMKELWIECAFGKTCDVIICDIQILETFVLISECIQFEHVIWVKTYWH